MTSDTELSILLIDDLRTSVHRASPNPRSPSKRMQIKGPESKPASTVIHVWLVSRVDDARCSLAFGHLRKDTKFGRDLRGSGEGKRYESRQKRTQTAMAK